MTITDTLDGPVKTVAVCTGSGASFIPQAARLADVYVTGDIKFHDAQAAQSLGLPVIDCGHFFTEKIFSDLLEAWLIDKGFGGTLKIFKSTVEKNPLTVISKGEKD
jgi:putative NIF3 family GTP cyclohydrolase 1 type 2